MMIVRFLKFKICFIIFIQIERCQCQNEKKLITSSFEFKSNRLLNVSTGWMVNNFYLFSRDYHHGAKFEDLDPRNSSSIKSCHFSSRKTFVIIHGFLGYGLEHWIMKLKNKLLQLFDSNVLVVDWPAGTTWFLPTYLCAARRVSAVGNNTATLISALIRYKGLSLKDVHCIGHSLGAHVCGFSAKFLKRKLARISGLDPAGPEFHNLTSDKRLDKSDASYVDVIHTNACSRWPYWTDCYGLNEDVGHSNFYPNGGQHQPGCSSYFSTGCDHRIVSKYYTSSLDFSANNSTYFLARPCDNWTQYLENRCPCGASSQFMGINVDSRLNGRFFLNVTATEPYGVPDDGCPVKSDSASYRNPHKGSSDAIRSLHVSDILGYTTLILLLVILVLLVVFRGGCSSLCKCNTHHIYEKI